jgi:rubrerythrin
MTNDTTNHTNTKRLEGTKTERNLMTAASGEAAAHTLYDLYAGAAYEEGYATVGDAMWNLSHQEKEHAEIWYDYLGMVGNTEENLESAIAKEGYEADAMYNEFANVAEEEGFDNIAQKFRLVAQIENNHRDILKNTLTELRDGTLYGKAPENAKWFCTNCGYIHEGPDAPERCPVCSYPKGYFFRYDTE